MNVVLVEIGFTSAFLEVAETVGTVEICADITPAAAIPFIDGNAGSNAAVLLLTIDILPISAGS